MKVVKKDNTKEPFNVQKVVIAVNKSAFRALVKFTDEEIDFICRFVQDEARKMGKEEIEISEMHNIVEGALERVNPKLRKVIVITEITSRTSYKCLMKFIRKVSRLCISVTRKIQILTVRLFRQREVLYLINLIKNFTRSFSLQQKNFKRVVTDIFTYTICRQDVIQ